MSALSVPGPDVGSVLVVEKTPDGRRELVVDQVAGVPGAFVIRNALSAAECAKLKQQVIRFHDAAVAREAERKRKREGGGGGGVGDHERKRVEVLSRRQSQHHVPHHAPPASMASLCKRLRPYLPTCAGPESGSDAAASPLCVSRVLASHKSRKRDSPQPQLSARAAEGGESDLLFSPVLLLPRRPLFGPALRPLVYRARTAREGWGWGWGWGGEGGKGRPPPLLRPVRPALPQRRLYRWRDDLFRTQPRAPALAERPHRRHRRRRRRRRRRRHWRGRAKVARQERRGARAPKDGRRPRLSAREGRRWPLSRPLPRGIGRLWRSKVYHPDGPCIFVPQGCWWWCWWWWWRRWRRRRWGRGCG